jgi:hypothetical protein
VGDAVRPWRWLVSRLTAELAPFTDREELDRLAGREGRVAGHLEPLTAMLRIGGGYGQRCGYNIAVRYHSPTDVELVGGNDAPKPEQWHDIRTVFLATPVETVRFKRLVGDGQFEEHAYSVSTGRPVSRRSRARDGATVAGDGGGGWRDRPEGLRGAATHGL